MKLYLEGFTDIYEIESLARMLYPNTKRGTGTPCGDYILCKLTENEMSVTINSKTKSIPRQEDIEYGFCRLMYELSGKTLPWGMLTGIRPIKLYHNMDPEYIKSRYLVSDEMHNLSIEVAKREDEINKLSSPNGYSLYISIPFCPHRCSYCSFVSHDIHHMHNLIPAYLKALKLDISKTLETADKLNLKLETIYIGGGTPTTLSAEQLDDLLSLLDNRYVLEFTVEAGRPDTITKEKLEVLHKHNVNRISINPQSMNNRILEAVGRTHTSQDIIDTFKLAKQVGIPIINMDLIAGLEDETVSEFIASLYEVIKLNPENITVHSLTLKRASALTEEGKAEIYYKKQEEITQMVENARKILTKAGYNPYYLYRQKNTVGALHNIGYAKTGTEGYYNVFIMDETHSILACGAGAVTKLKEPNGPKISRLFEAKFPQDYIARSVEIVKKQDFINSFNSEK